MNARVSGLQSVLSSLLGSWLGLEGTSFPFLLVNVLVVFHPCGTGIGAVLQRKLGAVPLFHSFQGRGPHIEVKDEGRQDCWVGVRDWLHVTPLLYLVEQWNSSSNYK